MGFFFFVIELGEGTKALCYYIVIW